MIDENNKQEDTNIEKPEEIQGDGDDIIIDEEEGDYRKVLKKLKEKLKVCESEKQTYLEGWQRAKADYINIRKSEEKNLLELEPLIKAKIFSDLLSIPDHFEMAFSNKESWEKIDKNWRAGIEGIYLNVVKVFGSFGVEQFGKEGEKFNANEYQAIGSIEIDDKEKEDIILEIVQKGYRFRGKVLRPAKVRVGVLKR